MNKKELEETLKICKQQIDIFQNQLKGLEQQMREMETQEEEKVWQPEKGEKYWTIVTDGEVWQTYYNDGDSKILKVCNYFKTEKEGKRQAEYNKVINRFRKYVEEHSKPLDWSNGDQPKYYLYYSCSSKAIMSSVHYGMMTTFQIYASSEQVLEEAIIYSAGSEKEFARIVFGVENNGS